VLGVLKGDSSEISDAAWEKLARFDYLIESGKFVTFKTKKDFIAFLKRHPTKKQTQKALLADQPAPAALSIPDDACHYHHDELRTLTVREMARIQSFPDNFEFRSKITTGGQMRAFEVPQYTQVGNAVPPLLGRALGLAISNLLKRNI
jgi:DNA (cytosine-5)-methyltransferase 1